MDLSFTDTLPKLILDVGYLLIVDEIRPGK
jgi:hypothetical protein